jgi:diadenosine tetraphosphatase ApaH/serine/threonine PP2A family protein phosphatase
MRHAVLSDIHGNLEALEAVITDARARGVGAMACLGDFVGYGASPNECIERVRPLIDVAVAGNHDLAACGRLKLGYFNPDAASAARWTDEQLTPENRAYLEELPFSALWRDMLLVHASPANPGDWNYVLSPVDAEEEMQSYEESICLIGHSHYPGTFEWVDSRIQYRRDPEIQIEKGRRYLVNVASVGQPRDGDPRAGYLLIDDAESSFTHVRLEYDIEGAMKRIEQAGLPRFLAERLRWGE